MLDRAFAIEDYDIGDTEARWANSDPQFRADADVPLPVVLNEPLLDGLLPGGVIVLPHRSQLKFAVHIVGVGFVLARVAEIFFKRNQGCGHRGYFVDRS